ncbi:MAG TPA: hypothetical protein VJZ00_11880 [Thermoanaerobaculia bacterium]|nr:hypothetical protein [Thermoanaerobaculia bacterium]
MRKSSKRDRGSALLVSLMVMAGLSLLALAFVAVSQTESAISANERNAVQTKAIAEAGARAAVEWFQAPAWALSIGIMPANVDNGPPPAGMKRVRTVGAAYSGVYKPLATQRLFDLPYRPAPQNRFYGDDATADIQIDYDTAPVTMANLNAYLFGSDSRVDGHIAEIKVYAPPIVGGTLVNGFWVNGDRFGTATIKATAEKWTREVGGTLVSRQIVRIVVGEFPLPIPAGPIQTASNAAFGGNFQVHWGDEVALGNLDPSRTSTRIPWQNPFNRPAFERGYDDVVWPVNASNPNMLYELAGKSFEDPWIGARARGNVTTCGACGTYNQTSVEGQPVHAAFQGQTTTSYPNRRAVTFPTIDYNIWKRIAIQGRGTKGVYYFTFDPGTGGFRLNGQGTARDAAFWVNSRSPGAGLGPAFYFFDTRSATNPQLTGGGTNAALLTPALSWNNSDFNGDFLMQGFIYFNAAEFGTTGVGSSPPTLPYNMPGEMYRDIGYPVWDTATNTWSRDPTGAINKSGSGNGQWDFQDINRNGQFDVVINPAATPVTSFDPGISAPRNVFLPKTWHEGAPACTQIGAVTDCSEPHEPYLNFIYPTTNSANVQVGWEPDATQTRRPRDLIGNALPNCNTNPELCTSNGYDYDGALVNIDATLNGVLYNEGAYSSTGNVDYFGSVLIRGVTDAHGTPNVWFDEKLIKGNWAPAGMPRVIVYNSQTDEQ